VNAQQRQIARERDEQIGDGAVETIVRAWNDLQTCRPIGMIAGLIPWTAMDRWCEVEQLDEDGRRIVIQALRWLDIEDFKKRNPKKSPTTRPQGSR
jgi:hypothetical protein